MSNFPFFSDKGPSTLSHKGSDLGWAKKGDHHIFHFHTLPQLLSLSLSLTFLLFYSRFFTHILFLPLLFLLSLSLVLTFSHPFSFLAFSKPKPLSLSLSQNQVLSFSSCSSLSSNYFSSFFLFSSSYTLSPSPTPSAQYLSSQKGWKRSNTLLLRQRKKAANGGEWG